MPMLIKLSRLCDYRFIELRGAATSSSLVDKEVG